jgi:cytochrome d ubiquinol oxidase subunit II
MSVALLSHLLYVVICLSLVFYVVLDGFDLGVGMLHLFVKKDEERRIFLNAIGPVWDGNAVWLVIIGGGLFAGFPEVYATLFSTFYIPVMALLFGLIFRAVSIEFRSKRPSAAWRSTWDVMFSLASFIIAFGIGLVLGNLIEGLPLDAYHNFVGSFGDFLRPYALLTGVLSIALLMMHGAIFLLMKTEGALRKRVQELARICLFFFVALYVLTTAATWVWMPHMLDHMHEALYLLLVGAGALIAILFVWQAVKLEKAGRAFVCSCLSIALLVALFCIGTYPMLIRSCLSPATNSLTIANAASSPLTLKVLMVIVLIGVPLVLAYGYYIYRVFRGKVRLGPSSY